MRSYKGQSASPHFCGAKGKCRKKADHILIINRGQVAGYGTHDELATTSTVYQQILASQEVTA